MGANVRAAAAARDPRRGFAPAAVAAIPGGGETRGAAARGRVSPPLAIAAAVVAVAGALALAVRRRPGLDRAVRLGLAAAIGGHELVWYGHVLALGWIDPPRGLPLDLCDVVLWLTVYGLVRPGPRFLEILYYAGLAGSGMAILTPDLAVPLPSYPAIAFFVGHGGVVAALLYLVFVGSLRPSPRSWMRAFLWVNAYALAVGIFDAVFGTNYFYLREKPAAPSLLDLLGPWPWYVVAGEAVALVLFRLLALPFGERARAGRGGP
jgi:hypothetical integral membrane protein (TIGR02206 family)